MADLTNALQDPVSAVHHACRADALRVVRHERARGVAARIVRAIDAILYSEAVWIRVLLEMRNERVFLGMTPEGRAASR